MTHPCIVTNFVQAVAAGNHPEEILSVLDLDQLRELAVELAERLTHVPGPVGALDVALVTDHVTEQQKVCGDAARLAAHVFGVPVECLTAPDRRRSVADARAVAQSAVRRLGLTLPTIATYFGQHHATVLYALDKVAASPRLHHAATQLEEHLLAGYGDLAA